jgi:hypothetical protein
MGFYYPMRFSKKIRPIEMKTVSFLLLLLTAATIQGKAQLFLKTKT